MTVSGIICPACGSPNLQGADTCKECNQSLVGQSGEKAGVFDMPLHKVGVRKPECVERGTTVAEVLDRLKGRNVGCVLVVGDEGRLVGIFTERDVLYRVAGLVEKTDELPVDSLMTPRPSALASDASLGQLLHLMALHGLRHVPIVDAQQRPVGFVAYRDILRFIEGLFDSAA